MVFFDETICIDKHICYKRNTQENMATSYFETKLNLFCINMLLSVQQTNEIGSYLYIFHNFWDSLI